MEFEAKEARKKAAFIHTYGNNCFCFHHSPPILNHANNKSPAGLSKSLTVLGDQKKPPPIRGEGLLRGTTLLALLIQDHPDSVKPLWTALTGDSRHRLICSGPTHSKVGFWFTSGVCLIQAQQASSNFLWRSKGTLLGSHISLPTRCRMIYYSRQTNYSVVKLTGPQSW